MTARERFWDALDRLDEMAGRPAKDVLLAAVEQARRLRAERARRQRELVPGKPVPPPVLPKLPFTTLDDWLRRRTVPRDTEKLLLLVEAYGLLAALPSDLAGRERWQRLLTDANAPGQAREPDGAIGDEDPWLRAVAGGRVWERVADEYDAGPLKEQALTVVRSLIGLRDEAYPGLKEDPWRDEHLALRIARWTDSLITNQLSGEKLDFSPAEAALLALLPFLYDVRRARAAVLLSVVGPTDLDRTGSTAPDRQAYETFLRGHDRLVRRTKLGHLRDRADGEREIGWWLFHQWVLQCPTTVRDLRTAAGADDTDIWAVLEPGPLTRLLSGVRVPPHDLCGIGRTGHLRAESFFPDLGDTTWQEVRERLVGLLFAVAQTLAIEVTELPATIVKHVGIPDPIGLSELDATLQGASWKPQPGGLSLRAQCRHPAVVAALHTHTERVDHLLRSVRRSASGAVLHTLPVYANADGVQEVDVDGERVSVSAVTRFRLDEDRVQELLMGENLYRDRSLAIRELYQNALDACRYRRAREQALSGQDLDGYRGRIEFSQDVDVEGRHYLECRDNGVGMGEAELSGVFSQAGVRFTDQAEYSEEEESWEARGIAMHPNSRFGIGVLSYFMLADEIRVTTCRMDGVDGRRTELTALITGPGHYFRMRASDRPRGIGTTVRLYLRDGKDAPSCVKLLRRLLGIAEFETSARMYEDEPVVWQPGRLSPRQHLAREENGLNAHGKMVSWHKGPRGVDGQVVWCEHGGGVLADGILTRPRFERGILTSLQEDLTLSGALVNLTGSHSPENLSIDRSEILDPDTGNHVESLVREAVPQLLSAPDSPLDWPWLAQVSAHSPLLADTVTEAAIGTDRMLQLHGRPYAMGHGFFPMDDSLLWPYFGKGRRRDPEDQRPANDFTAHDSVPDYIILWRLLAQGPDHVLIALTELVPELARVKSVLPARPTDVLLLTDKRIGASALGRQWETRDWETLVNDTGEYKSSTTPHPGRLLAAALRSGIPLREIVARAAELYGQDAPVMPEHHSIQPWDAALLSSLLWEGSGWLGTRQPVPPGHLVKAHLEFNISVVDVARRLEGYGFSVPPDSRLPRSPDETALTLLSRDLNGNPPWLSVTDPVPAFHVYRLAHRLSQPVTAIHQALSGYGFTCEDPGFLSAGPGADKQQLIDRLSHIGEWLWPRVAPGLVAQTAQRLGLSLGYAARTLQILGLEVPPELPDAVDDNDLEILRQSPSSADNWLMPGSSVPAGLMLEKSERLGLPLEYVEERLRRYGLRVPDLRGLGAPEQHDLALLSVDFEGGWPWLEQEKPVTRHHILKGAARTGVRPSHLIRRLEAYGLRPAETELPDVLPDRNVLRLLSWDLSGSGLFLRSAEDIGLHHLLRAGVALDLPLREVAERLTELGLSVPDPAETVRAALARVPGLVMESGSPPS